MNGELLTLRMALDQGYWPDSGLTAPDVAALRRDVELVKELGLNGVRKHQKIEDPRWLAFCDELGVLVWEELPSAHEFSPSSVVSWTTEWMRVISRDRSHPSIIGWVPVNEGWGLPDLMHDEQQRAALRALTELTRSLDPDRLISANDGWRTSGGDVIGIHDYGQSAATLSSRYASAESVRELFGPVGPAIHRLTLDGSTRSPGRSWCPSSAASHWTRTHRMPTATAMRRRPTPGSSRSAGSAGPCCTAP